MFVPSIVSIAAGAWAISGGIVFSIISSCVGCAVICLVLRMIVAIIYGAGIDAGTAFGRQSHSGAADLGALLYIHQQS